MTYFQRFICFLFVTLLGLTTTACVTTVEGPFTKKANPTDEEQKYIELALALIQRKQFDHARKSIERAKAINPKSAKAFATMGLLYQQEEEFELAEKEFLRSLELDENYTQGRSWYAAFLYSRKRYQEALEQFEIASKDTTYASRAQVFMNLGLSAEQLNKDDIAQRAYSKVLVLNANDANALIALIDLQIKKGNYSAAKNYYRRLQELIRSGVTKHSLKTLGQGFMISLHFNNREGASGFLLLMEKRFPGSAEYAKYKAMLTHE